MRAALLLALLLMAAPAAAAPAGVPAAPEPPVQSLVPGCITIDWLLMVTAAEAYATDTMAIWEFNGTATKLDGVLTIQFDGEAPVAFTIREGCAVRPDR